MDKKKYNISFFKVILKLNWQIAVVWEEWNTSGVLLLKNNQLCVLILTQQYCIPYYAVSNMSLNTI